MDSAVAGESEMGDGGKEMGESGSEIRPLQVVCSGEEERVMNPPKVVGHRDPPKVVRHTVTLLVGKRPKINELLTGLSGGGFLQDPGFVRGPETCLFGREGQMDEFKLETGTNSAVSVLCCRPWLPWKPKGRFAGCAPQAGRRAPAPGAQWS
ncbi:unnamed protein product [Pleuronectes platessa]|uniref:Uncharacterized protein n=1 Tax=Pleuronectes platessa TaxID=8262 RepID=A0A9N7UR51_PLEPL|nr:unnamed protein product [Pleuronectes platessa]